MYGGCNLHLEGELLTKLFINYLKYCHETGTHRMTDKYKFIAFIHLNNADTPEIPLYPKYSEKEKKSLCEWLAQG